MDEDVRELCNTALDYMDELSPAIVQLYNEIRESDLSNMTVISSISEGLLWLANASAMLNGKLKLNIQAEINNIFTQIKETALAMENNDYLFLADILEFDVLPNLEKIFNAIRDV